ncbi:LacI family transcriptional regulator [Agromyces atrinae]|uniref:LacI family DNA-binding transcriptional regulator n=1 Tax=Agromyces atrinae TaxID=592376 RepID=UPI001F57FA28|nr:LacI family DNA-binding transcriptional regulator [Agromyces atrinae]MCI2957644.1 LacI family transcriptional regulator [Agromyces atrinae]
MERARPTTIADVAQHAGVSQASVSRVLNGKASVDPRIVEVVTASIAALGYTPSTAARSLVSGRNNTVAMIVPDLENPLFQGILKGLSRAAALDGYRVLVADTAEIVADEEVIAIEARHRTDAIVLCAPRMPEKKLRDVLARVAPAVVVNRPIDETGTPVVGVDYVRGIRDLVEHLAGLGHTRLVYLAGPAPSASNRERERGLAEILAARPDLTITTIAAGSALDDGYRATDEVIDAVQGEVGATAVLAFNDLVALGLMRGLSERGVSVPGEVSVAGFDDVPLASFSSPPLTSMSVPRSEIGEQVWQRLRALIAGAAVDHAVLYSPRLEARESTGSVDRA